MAINIVKGKGPFVIDRQAPPELFQRAPGSFSFVAMPPDNKRPRLFDTADKARELLYQELDEEALGAYRWNIVPADSIKWDELEDVEPPVFPGVKTR